MAEELEKTCENCKYDYEDMEGTHCRHCIHNAEERFEPKVIVPTVAEIRAKAIDEFAEALDDLILHGIFDSRNHLHECIHEITEELKGGGE